MIFEVNLDYFSQGNVATMIYIICLGATVFALHAAIFCSLTNGVHKLQKCSYEEKFRLVKLTILAAAKHFAMKLKLKTFMKQLNCFTKLRSRALQLQPVLRTIMMSHRIPCRTFT